MKILKILSALFLGAVVLPVLVSAAAVSVYGLASQVNFAVGTHASDSASTSANVTANASSSLIPDSTASSSTASGTAMTRDDLDSAVGMAPLAAAQVTTADDVAAYESTSLKADTNLRKLDLGADHVSVSYDEHGHLLGFIPVTMPVTATVDAAGNVTLDYPWYGFLVTADRNSLESAVQDSVASTTMAELGGGFTPSQEAMLADNLTSALRLRFESDSSTTATSTSSY